MTNIRVPDSALDVDNHDEFPVEFSDQVLDYETSVKKHTNNLVGNVETNSTKKYIKYESEEELLAVLEALEEKGYFINGANADKDIKEQRKNSSFPSRGIMCVIPGLGLQYFDYEFSDKKELSTVLFSNNIVSSVDELLPFYKNPENLKEWQDELENRKKEVVH